MKLDDYEVKILTPSQIVEMEELFSRLESLSDDQRKFLFEQYCSYCGCDDPRCQCWNDE